MNLKGLCAAAGYSQAADLALLLLRVIAGLAFMMHGWPKIQNPFGWMGPDGFAPAILQALAALSEFGGGVAWTLGLMTRLASVGIASTMAVAFWTHAFMRGDPFVSKTGGPAFELASIYFGIALVLLALGPGRYSIDRKLFGGQST